MSDLISRQAMIDMMKRHRALFCKNRIEFMALPKAEKARVDEIDNCISDLVNAPDAELEQKKGCWVPVTNGRGGFECDQCHNYALSYQNGDEYLSYFCPNCGVKMTGGE